MEYKIRSATADDGDAMLALMPRLSEFEIPESRDPEHLWRDDAALLRQWIAGEADDCLVHVAEGGKGAILGLTLVRLRPEALSHEPSSHLEAIAVSKDAEGKGIAKFLKEHCRSPEFFFRFRWEPHSIAFWDNRCCHHYAINDYLPQVRSGYRVQIEGYAPPQPA